MFANHFVVVPAPGPVSFRCSRPPACLESVMGVITNCRAAKCDWSSLPASLDGAMKAENSA